MVVYIIYISDFAGCFYSQIFSFCCVLCILCILKERLIIIINVKIYIGILYIHRKSSVYIT